MKQLAGVLVWVAFYLVGCAEDPPERPAESPPPPATLTRHDPEPAGQNCPRGGTAIRVGPDRNGNGMLDDDEVEHTDFVCAPATAVLVRQDPLPPSLTCPAGGLAVQTGIDDNANGVLEDAEIDQTTTVCSSLELWNGNFTAEDWNDPIKVAALRSAHVVAGSLNVARPIELPSLELVVGDLLGSDGFALPALREVAGSVTVGSTGDAVPSLPELGRIGGTLSVSGSGAQLNAPVLRDVLGDVLVTPIGTSALALPGLATIGGTLRVHANVFASGIGELHLDQLTSIQGSLVVEHEALLAELVLPTLTTVGGDIDVSNRQHLATIAMASLHDVGGDVLCDFSDSITTASLPSLRTIGGSLSFQFIPALTTLRLDNLFIVGGGLLIEQAPLLTTLTLFSLAQLGEVDDLGFPVSIRISDTSIASLDLIALHNVSSEVSVGDNSLLQTIRLPVLATAPSLVFGGDSQLERIEAPKITSLTRLLVAEPALHAMDFAALDSVFDLELQSDTLPDLSGLSRLTRADNLLMINCNQLHDLHGLSRLLRVDALTILDNAALVSLDGLPLVFELRNSLHIQSNRALTSLAGLANVGSVGPGGIVLFDNSQLADVAMTHLQVIEGQLVIENLPALTTLSGFADLRALGGELLLIIIPNVPADDIAAFERQIGR